LFGYTLHHTYIVTNMNMSTSIVKFVCPGLRGAVISVKYSLFQQSFRNVVRFQAVTATSMIMTVALRQKEHLWNIGQLLRDYTAHYPKRLSRFEMLNTTSLLESFPQIMLSLRSITVYKSNYMVIFSGSRVEMLLDYMVHLSKRILKYVYKLNQNTQSPIRKTVLNWSSFVTTILISNHSQPLETHPSTESTAIQTHHPYSLSLVLS
jgi:hypothetical protein